MTDEARRARDLLGLPVLTVAEGQRLGQVGALLVRREDRSVAAVGIRGGTLGRLRYLPFSQVRSVGPDALMVEGESVLQEQVPAEESRELDAGLPGRPVVTESGQKLGEITGFAVNVESGRIELYHMRVETSLLGRLKSLVKRDEVDIPDTMAVRLGADALIVTEDAVSLGEPDASEE